MRKRRAPKAAKDALKAVTSGRVLGTGATILEAPHSEPASFADCKGIRVRGTGRLAGESIAKTSDAYAVSDGTTLYLFTLRCYADYYKNDAGIFQKSVATVRLTAAN